MTITSHRGKIKLEGTCQNWRGIEGIKPKLPYLKVSATEPIFSGACQAEKATIAGI